MKCEGKPIQKFEEESNSTARKQYPDDLIAEFWPWGYRKAEAVMRLNR